MGWIRGLLKAAALALAAASYTFWIFRAGTGAPFLYASAGLAALFLLAMAASKGSPWRKALLFNAAFLFLAVAAAEAYSAGWFSPKGGGAERKYEGEFFERNGRDYFVLEEIRGYAARKGVKARARIVSGDEVLYDVVYTINRDGLRICPHDVAEEPPAAGYRAKDVLFFGCSVTVGEGVTDRETLPWTFEALSEGKYRAHNFGFHGYGPHQMLRVLETGLSDGAVRGTPPPMAVYQGLMEHIERAAGNYPAISWGPATPKYLLDSQGIPRYAGPFFSPRGVTVIRILNQSHLFRKVAPGLLGRERSREDIGLFVAIVSRAKEVFERRYNGRFSVVMWGAYDKDYPQVVERLRKANVTVFETHRIIPDIHTADRKHKIPGDEHPNGAVHARIARFLLENLEKEVPHVAGR